MADTKKISDNDLNAIDLDNCDTQPSKDAMELANLIYDIYQDKKKMETDEIHD